MSERSCIFREENEYCSIKIFEAALGTTVPKPGYWMLVWEKGETEVLVPVSKDFVARFAPSNMILVDYA